MLLEVLDAARITLANGVTLVLSRFYVVLTSNFGAADVMQLQRAPLRRVEKAIVREVASVS
jgi:ATP-dependent Clp protease ATP-binding subunit ClpA